MSYELSTLETDDRWEGDLEIWANGDPTDEITHRTIIAAVDAFEREGCLAIEEVQPVTGAWADACTQIFPDIA